MTKDGILVLQCLFENIWRLFTSWNIPGTEVTPAGFLVFLAFCGLVLRWLSRLFDVQIGANAAVHAATDVSPVANVPGKRAGSFSFKKE